MLSDKDIFQLHKQMCIKTPLMCLYKDHLVKEVYTPNTAYIINLADERDDNFGTHYTLLYSKRNKHKNDTLEHIYFDSYGFSCPNEVLEFINQPKIPYCDKNIQGKFQNSCGFMCLAYLYYITTFESRIDDLYLDTEMFLDLFDDTNEKIDTLHNEMMLKEFFKTIPKNIDEKYINHID